MERVIITGATSMIGVALIKECIKKKTFVSAVIRPNSMNRHRIPDSEYVQITECDIANIGRLTDLISGKHDCFFHLAWDGTSRDLRNSVFIHEENIKYTLLAVGEAKKLGCEVFLGTGSQAEYGRVSDVISPDTSANPEYAYGIAKLAAGKLSQQHCIKLGLRFVWARIFSVFGEYDNSGTMITYLIKALLDRQRPKLTKCEQMWDYLYCGDAARALYLAGEDGSGFYCVGSGKMRPLIEYVTIIRDIIDENLPLGIGELPYVPQQVMRLCADISSLQKDTGFIQAVDFATGIKNTVEWIREERGARDEKN